MHERLRRWFASPPIAGDDEKKHRVSLLNATTNTGIIFIVLLFLGNLFDPLTPLRNFFIDLLILAVFLIARHELRKGNIFWVGFGIMSAVFGLMIIAIASEGTIRAPAVANLVLLVIVSGILFDIYGILISVAACSLAVLALIQAQNSGLLPAPSNAVGLIHWFMLTLTFALTGGLTYFTHLVTLEALKRSKIEIQERERIESVLRVSDMRFRSLFEQTHDAIFILDQNGRHVDANERAADMLGYSREEILTLSVRDTSAEIGQSQNIIGRLLSGEAVPVYERLFRKKSGQVFPVEINVELILDQSGNPGHILSMVRDISSRKETEAALKTTNAELQRHILEVETLQAELREQALHDSLTGLYNRRFLDEALPREIIRADRENDFLSVIICDLDHFKGFNDTYGHKTGDLFLIETARLIKACMRGSDIVCRYGGEEFVMVLPDLAPDAAVKRAEEIRQKCAQMVVWHEGRALQITISFGVATYPVHAKTGEEVIIKADQALYQSKNLGRDRVSVWSEMLTTE